MERYSEILSNAISTSGLKLGKIAEKVGEISGNQITREYLSRLQNGKSSPASDKTNDALSHVLNINPLELKTAAYREKIPADVLEKLQT